MIEDLKAEMTYSGALPYALNDKEIARILKNDCLYFWDNWSYAVEKRYILVETDIFNNAAFKKHRQIVMPECVQFVTNFKEITGGSIFATIDRDFAEQKFIGSEIYLTPFMGESIMYRTIMFSFLDLTKSMMIDTVSYEYNKNSKRLFVKGRTPKVKSVMEVYIRLEKEDLYKDELFQRYVRAHCKVRNVQMLSALNFTLPGDGSLNYQTMASSAEAELTAVKEQMIKEQPPGWMILSNF